jgi:hypothetical protein
MKSKLIIITAVAAIIVILAVLGGYFYFTNKTLNQKDVTIGSNSAEIDLKCTLFEKGSKTTYLKMEYFVDGKENVKQFDSKTIPEIKDIFENSKDIPNTEPGYKIVQAQLNNKILKAYFPIQGAASGKEVNTTLYSFDLKSGTIQKVFSQSGIYSEPFLSFSKNNAFYAFSYSSGLDSYLQIAKATNDEVVVNKNNNKKGVLIGSPEETVKSYAISAGAWSSDTSIGTDTDIRDASGNSIKKGEFLYDVEKDKFLTTDGSEMIPGKTQVAVVTAESDSVKALREFYAAVGKSDFASAYNMLDDNFKSTAFKGLGAPEMTKKDTDLAKFSAFGSLLQSAKIDKILDEKTEGNISTVNFTQSVMGIPMSLVVEFNKVGDVWKVLSLADGK